MDSEWFSRRYKDVPRPPDSDRCNAYAVDVREKLKCGNLTAYTLAAMLASGLFSFVRVGVKHIGYKIFASKEFAYDLAAAVAFTDAFDDRPKARALSKSIKRGKKIFKSGVQYMAGVHGSGQGGKKGASMPHQWSPGGKDNPWMMSLMRAHVHDVEGALTKHSPEYVAHVKSVMTNAHATPYALTPLGIATTIATSLSLVAGPHTDDKGSMREAIWSAILFICVQRVPNWTFHAGTHLYELPTTPGMARLIILDATEIMHGTCYTSAEHENHRNIGTVLTFNISMVTACETAVNGKVCHTGALIASHGLQQAQEALEFAERMRAMPVPITVYTDAPNATLLVLDVEGAYETLLRDFPSLLTNARGIYCEIDGTPEQTRALHELATGAGMTLTLKTSQHRVYVRGGDGDPFLSMRVFCGVNGYYNTPYVKASTLCEPLHSFSLTLPDGSTRMNGDHEGSEQAITHRLIQMTRDTDGPQHIVEFGGGIGGNTIQIAKQLRPGDTLTVYEPRRELGPIIEQNMSASLTPTQRSRVTLNEGTLSLTPLSMPPFDPCSNWKDNKESWLLASTSVSSTTPSVPASRQESGAAGTDAEADDCPVLRASGGRKRKRKASGDRRAKKKAMERMENEEGGFTDKGRIAYKNEGGVLVTGGMRTCVPDAILMLMSCFSIHATEEDVRSMMPHDPDENTRFGAADQYVQQFGLTLQRVTQRFLVKGGPELNLLQSDGCYVVQLTIAEGKEDKRPDEHCVAYDGATVRDNYKYVKVKKLDASDRESPAAARNVFDSLAKGFDVRIKNVYELKRM